MMIKKEHLEVTKDVILHNHIHILRLGFPIPPEYDPSGDAAAAWRKK